MHLLIEKWFPFDGETTNVLKKAIFEIAIFWHRR